MKKKTVSFKTISFHFVALRSEDQGKYTYALLVFSFNLKI